MFLIVEVTTLIPVEIRCVNNFRNSIHYGYVIA